MITPTLRFDGHESLSLLVKQCPLPTGGPGAGQIALYETVGGHFKDWSGNGPFQFDSATVLDSSNGLALWVLAGVEVSGFHMKAPHPLETIREYAAAIRWADATPVGGQVLIAPMSMRERFEALHPVPEGVQFDEHLKVYYVEPGPHNPAKQLHCMCWSMWVQSRAEMSVDQAGREPILVELPRPFMSGYTESGNCPATDLYSFDDVKSAIETAGGRVKR